MYTVWPTLFAISTNTSNVYMIAWLWVGACISQRISLQGCCLWIWFIPYILPEVIRASISSPALPGLHDITLFSRLSDVFQGGLGLLFYLINIYVLNVGQLTQDRLLLLLLLVVLRDHLGQFCGQLHVICRSLNLRVVQFTLNKMYKLII